ncbi:biotin/lipoyl-containing protein [Chitinibacteraceae bacterium HSL-7]
MTQTTTHLICAPQLEQDAAVDEIHVSPGQWVTAQTLLVTLNASDGAHVVLALAAGQVSTVLVAQGDPVGSDELLLLMEVEEEDEPWAVSEGEAVCVALESPMNEAVLTDVLQVTRSACGLAARLGVNLADVPPAEDGVVSEACVEAWVRQQLRARG